MAHMMYLVVLFAVAVHFGSTARAVEIFDVGESEGWVVPTEVDMYRRWASNKTFHVNDVIHFSHVNDSVAIVTQEDYENCKIDPIRVFYHRETYYCFRWPGCYYFISGKIGHCELGQKVAVEVMPSNMNGSPQESPDPHSADPWQLLKSSRRRHGYSIYDFLHYSKRHPYSVESGRVV
ncbi:hypothetical protein LUZ61_000737 [Rhynchospora tenuis]|uniref:Phytocyanin domain-containing protein n=1 Tax=Rhynchospora tenuis TaxID=198213 RepID=A0AAD6EQ44_9POAL|nr:hypothetical protein LUZ61_000737 [Rhynchospora tenuis]